jgi:hypothetical protein
MERIKMDLKEKVCDSLDWIYLAECRDHWWALVNMIMNLQIIQEIISVIHQLNELRLIMITYTGRLTGD